MARRSHQGAAHSGFPAASREFHPRSIGRVPGESTPIGNAFGLTGAFWITFLILLALEKPLNGMVRLAVTEMRSEYGLLEQLSKFYLLLIVIVALRAYQVAARPAVVKLSLAIMMLGLSMYLAESNMITERTQPLFALVFLPYTLLQLARARSYFTPASLAAGFGIVGAGSVLDRIREEPRIQAYLGLERSQFLEERFREELLDTIGIAVICFAVLMHFKELVVALVRDHWKTTAGLLLSLVLIAAGNGFLHFQYNPTGRFKFVALLTTLVGFVGLLAVERRAAADGKLALISEEGFYFFTFTFFVIVPAVFGRSDTTISLMLWLPTLLALAAYLHNRHLSCHGERAVP